MVDTQQEPLIPAWTYGQVWRNYQRYCKGKMLNPFSDTSVAIWEADMTVKVAGEYFPPPEIEIVDDIVRAGLRTS
ncbi:MAG TPA: hypothetical protein VMW69_08390 [Spirochaetia bacterium]|nr:hypothetical protein [Spirochaetia bacterium]